MILESPHRPTQSECKADDIEFRKACQAFTEQDGTPLEEVSDDPPCIANDFIDFIYPVSQKLQPVSALLRSRNQVERPRVVLTHYRKRLDLKWYPAACAAFLNPFNPQLFSRRHGEAGVSLGGDMG